MSGPISMFVPAALIAFFCVPLVLRIVPPNRYYGFRTAQTLGDREAWFGVNRFAGGALLVAVSLTTCLYFSAPELASGQSFTGVLALVLPTLAALLVTRVYARKLTRRSA